MQRPGVQGERAPMGSHWGAGKGGEVQSRFAHTRFLLALLVQSQIRRQDMSKLYQVGPEGTDTKSEGGSDRKRCKFPLHAHWGVGCSAACAQGGWHLAQCACCVREGGEAEALPGELVTNSVTFQGP